MKLSFPFVCKVLFGVTLPHNVFNILWHNLSFFFSENDGFKAIREVEMDESVLLLEELEELPHKNQVVSERLSSGSEHGDSTTVSSTETPNNNHSIAAPQNNSVVNGSFNKQLRVSIIREIRKPGKGWYSFKFMRYQLPFVIYLSVVLLDHRALFELLSTIKGSVNTRLLFLRDMRHEALRFKRRLLANDIEQVEMKALQQLVDSGQSHFCCKSFR